MAADITCPRCGAANRPGTSFCSNCGSPLSAGAAAPSPAPPMYPSTAPAYPPGYASPLDMERRKQIDRTKTGVLLLLVGTLISWVPFIGVIGSLLILIGVILVILGRRTFGPGHARNVVVSIVLFFLGIIISVIGGVVLGVSIATGLFGGTPTLPAIQSALNNFLILLAVGSIVGGLASVFFTFALQNQMGKILLLAAYGAGIAIEVAILVVVSGDIAQIAAAMFPGGNYDPTAAAASLVTFQAHVASLTLLVAIPSLLYAGAYYLVWNRINKGEIPAPSGPPGATPPAMPPTAPR